MCTYTFLLCEHYHQQCFLAYDGLGVCMASLVSMHPCTARTVLYGLLCVTSTALLSQILCCLASNALGPFNAEYTLLS